MVGQAASKSSQTPEDGGLIVGRLFLTAFTQDASRRSSFFALFFLSLLGYNSSDSYDLMDLSSF